MRGGRKETSFYMISSERLISTKLTHKVKCEMQQSIFSESYYAIPTMLSQHFDLPRTYLLLSAGKSS